MNTQVYGFPGQNKKPRREVLRDRVRQRNIDKGLVKPAEKKAAPKQSSLNVDVKQDSTAPNVSKKDEVKSEKETKR